MFVLNGVNLASLGERRPEIYGTETLQDIEERLRKDFPHAGFEVRQTDYEGEVVSWIREAANSRGLILNPGAWSHYSYAIHDALEVIFLYRRSTVQKVEVHLSNIHSREEAWRHASVISPVVDAVVAGMGVYGYRAAAGYIIAGTSG